VEEVYLPIQAALAFGQKTVDAGLITGRILPEGRMTMDRYCPNIGASGLAFFHFLFVTKLIDEGMTDYHTYRFARRYDGATVDAYMKTDCKPSSADFQEEYDEWLRKLDRARDQIIQKHDWVRFDKIVRDIFGNDVHIIDLDKDK
jgi:hypothetical protein